MDSQFDDEDLYDVPDLQNEYYFAFHFKCKGFTKLMKLILLTKKNPELVSQIAQYLIVCPEEVNKQNEKGFTALMLASKYSTKYSTEETVKVLIEAKAKVDIKSDTGYTALMCATLYADKFSSAETVKLLIEAKADILIKNNDGLNAAKLSTGYKVPNEVVKMFEEAMEQKVSNSMEEEIESQKVEIEIQKIEIERLRALITNLANQI